MGERQCKKTSIGGQALIEGLMMIGPKQRAIAVRNPQGEIVLEVEDNPKAHFLEKIPFIRGSVKLIRQMAVGMKALFRSADISELMEDEEEEGNPPQDEPGKGEKKESFFDKHPDALLALTVVLAIGMALALFAFLPNLITELLRRAFNLGAELSGFWRIGLSLLEGLIRILIFLIYLLITRKNKDIERVWCYHGAEHKTIACYEAGEELEVDNIKKYSRLHPRCGTSFLFLVMLVSVLVFSLTGWRSPLVNLLVRLLLLPVIAGISYELIRWAGKSDSKLAAYLSKPGLMLQNLTTAEPDADMIEVAIKAMTAVIPGDKSDFEG